VDFLSKEVASPRIAANVDICVTLSKITAPLTEMSHIKMSLIEDRISTPSKDQRQLAGQLLIVFVVF
jgi:hypothetical protein